MTPNEVRTKFLKFFESKGHKIVASDSVVPKNDPTVLFTTAGMQQFKLNFLGIDKTLKSAATSQKCIRTDDLDRVGKTAVHHTFFEMLGNFSFGDYFKREAIQWGWEFFTKEMGIPAEKLAVSVYKDDDEAYNIWLNDIKVPANRIVKLGDKSNFWPSNAKLEGPNGPCGPCSEIFYDFGVNPDCKNPDCDPDCECGRFAEIWNLVFTQFNRKDGGVLEPLPSKNIDTGMGLERLVAVVQGKRNNYESTLFTPIIEAIKKNVSQSLSDYETKVIADHIRAITFGINDGVIPSNEGRGYVIKRLIVDATDIALSRGVNGASIYKLVPAVVDVMKEPYPELLKEADRIASIIQKTEEAFLSVRKTRVPELEVQLKTIKTAQELGEAIFKFRDTFGLTLSTIEKTAQAAGASKIWSDSLKVFEQLMNGQKERSRAGSKMTGDVFADADLNLNVPKTQFLGYEQTSASAEVLKIFVENKEVPQAKAGQTVKIVLDQTPFYAESGGQVGDIGSIGNDRVKVQVVDTQKISDVFIHEGKVEQGTLNAGDTVTAAIDAERRLAIMRNHTATHLMQAALTEVLGAHIKQQGSLVAPDRLRFDFTHHKAITSQEIEAIEQKVNNWILLCSKVSKQSMPIEEARKLGARAYFAEKYGDIVRVVSIGDYSMEFCGGTHLDVTGQVGPFKIVSESAVAQGIRRIEAVTGEIALDWGIRKQKQLREIAELLKSPVDEVVVRVDQQTKRLKQLEKDVEALKFESIRNSLDEIIDKVQIINEANVIAHTFKNVDMNSLRKISDLLKQKVTSGVFILGAQNAEDGYLIIAVSDDLVKRGIKADQLVKDVAALIEGSGGGRPNMAQAGSKNPGKIPQAVEESKNLIRGKIAL